MRARQKIKRDLAAPLCDAGVIQLAADEAQERGFHLGVGDLGAAGDETHDGGCNLLGDQALTGAHDRGQRLLSGHRSEPQTVLRDARHRGLQAFNRGEIVLAQGNQHAIVAACEIEALGGRLVFLELGLELLRRTVFDKVRKIRDEARRACAPEVVALREREDFLELIEDQ